jgi:hypothetical protein
MKKDQELIVITKTYDLILWSCNHTSKFPRNHRFVLGERIERNLPRSGAGVCRWATRRANSSQTSTSIRSITSSPNVSG